MCAYVPHRAVLLKPTYSISMGQINKCLSVPDNPYWVLSLSEDSRGAQHSRVKSGSNQKQGTVHL